MNVTLPTQDTAQARRNRLQRALSPERIAFIGGGWVEAGLAYSAQLNFPGQLSVVNPKREGLGGVPCVPSVSDLPFVPDVAFVCVNKHATIGIIKELSILGTTAAICNASGFSEIGAAGDELQAALKSAAGDMLLIGPNAPGFVNFQTRAGVMMERFGYQPPGPGVALVTQGGAIMLDLLASDRDVPLTHMIGLGNQIDVTISECVDIVLGDPNVRAVAIYAEAMPDVVALGRVAIRALNMGKPLVVMKAGQTEAGGRAMFSHTASRMSPNDAVRAVFRRFGMIQVSTLPEMTETLKFLTVAGVPKGRRAAIVTASGMHSAIAADAAAQAGLDIAMPSAASLAEQAKVLPDIATPGNPLDLTTVYWGQRDPQAACYRALFEDVYDIALNVCNFPKAGTWDLDAYKQGFLGFADAVRDTGVLGATVTVFPESFPAEAKAQHLIHGIAPLQGLGEAMRGIANAARFGEVRQALLSREAADILVPPVAAPDDGASITVYDEHKAKDRLRAAGIPVPQMRAVSAQGLNREEIGFDGPYALKILDAGILHKSEVGGVTLGLADTDAVARSAAGMAEAVRASHPERLADTFLVEEFIDDKIAELCVGITRVDAIGLVMTLSAGGVLTELMRDQAVLLLPACREDIAEAIASLDLSRVLGGYRGDAAGDTAALTEAVQAVADYAHGMRDSLVELEINPLIVRPEGRGVVAVDAILRVSEKSGGD